jgi:hypothetical protein
MAGRRVPRQRAVWTVKEAYSLPMRKNLGMLLLGVWLILTGVIPLINLTFSGLGTMMAVLAIAAGALIITGK